MEFWTSERRGAVEIATFSNPPHNYIGKPQLDELAQLAAYEVENMNWTEVMQSDDAQVALSTFLAVDPASRRDWFESESTKTYPAYSGH
jgi:hypothetical protein